MTYLKHKFINGFCKIITLSKSWNEIIFKPTSKALLLYLDLCNTSKPINVHLIAFLEAWGKPQVYLVIIRSCLHTNSWSRSATWPTPLCQGVPRDPHFQVKEYHVTHTFRSRSTMRLKLSGQGVPCDPHFQVKEYHVIHTFRTQSAMWPTLSSQGVSHDPNSQVKECYVIHTFNRACTGLGRYCAGQALFLCFPH